MSTFTIDGENNITAIANPQEATGAGLTVFDSQAELTRISGDWPMSRLVEIWNSIPGNTEVKKFQDRKRAVARIWKAIQPLAANGQTSRAQNPAKACKAAKGGKPVKKANRAKKLGKASGRENKKALVVAMMKRTKGATLAEIMETTGWQAHTVRGFVSILGSKGGEKITSAKVAGERTYQIAK